MKNAVISINHDLAPPPVFGIVKTTYPRFDTYGPAVNDDDYSGAAELDIWAQRAFAANGFGDADVVLPDAARKAAVVGAPAAAAEHRSASLADICLAVGAAIGAALRKLVQRWREQRELRRTYSALSHLDERTLKDIGLGDHEAGSIAAELAGRAERTRIQALRTLRELAI